MSRAALIMFLVLSPATVWGGGPGPHVDRTIVKGGCRACHSAHGVAGSPMLTVSQKELCLSCHGTGTTSSAISSSARPKRLPIEKTYVHRIELSAFSRHDGGVVCTSCHSPHRGIDPGVRARGEKRLSTRDPDQFEFQLCGQCHGRVPGAAGSFGRFIALRLDPGNRSFHPVEAPAMDRSPSVDPQLAGREINCTDCHGNDDPQGARGPHGSSVPHILRAGYSSTDGLPESRETYALCYSCHDRDSVLHGDAFPAHSKHVVELRLSCSSCHDSHGSIRNRALIRLADGPGLDFVAPSGRTGRLAFESDGPGSGACWMTCHGHDHGPEAYGPMQLLLGTSDKSLAVPTPLPSRRRGVTRPSQHHRD